MCVPFFHFFYDARLYDAADTRLPYRFIAHLAALVFPRAIYTRDIVVICSVINGRTPPRAQSISAQRIRAISRRKKQRAALKVPAEKERRSFLFARH